MLEIMMATASVVAVAAWPRSWVPALCACVAAGVSVTTGAGEGAVAAALAATVPMAVFLAAALSLANLAVAGGLVAVAAVWVARAARGRPMRLYVIICLLTAVLTATTSLDAAVVLVAPMLVELHRRLDIGLSPYLLGAVAVANAVSAAVPQGNPTNLVLMHRLGLRPQAFAEHLLPSSLAAAAVAAAAVAILERRSLRQPVELQWRSDATLTADARRALAALLLAAAAGGGAVVLGVGPSYPFAGVAAVALLHERRRLVVPWRILVQVTSLLVLVEPLATRLPLANVAGTTGLFVVLAAVSALAAGVGNLPVGAAVAALPLSGSGSLGAVLGLSAGALATPHGSVATMLAAQLADPGGRIRLRRPLAVSASAAVVAAALVAALTLR